MFRGIYETDTVAWGIQEFSPALLAFQYLYGRSQSGWSSRDGYTQNLLPQDGQAVAAYQEIYVLMPGYLSFHPQIPLGFLPFQGPGRASINHRFHLHWRRRFPMIPIFR